jgi:tRNA A37 threonylcarbamoyladenosine biosynthesis protein TsaE
MDEWELPSGHRNTADVATDLSRCIAETPIRIVSIDGWSGSGKTTLARDLADRLSLRRCELDEYVHEQRGGFLEHLDYPRLSTALANVRTASAPVLVDGICVLEVLERLGLRSDLKVYVRKISASGIWHDGLNLDPSRTAEEVIEEDRQSAERWAEMHGKKLGEGGEPLAWEVLRYHYGYLPHESADVYFNRIEDA